MRPLLLHSDIAGKVLLLVWSLMLRIQSNAHFGHSFCLHPRKPYAQLKNQGPPAAWTENSLLQPQQKKESVAMKLAVNCNIFHPQNAYQLDEKLQTYRRPVV